MDSAAIGTSANIPDVQVIRYNDALRPDFARLNLEWIERYFEVEEPDRKSLGDPRGTIIDQGGEIFFVVENGATVGTCALIKHDGGRYELAKMAVTPQCQGRGFGNLLMQAILDETRRKGGREIFLLSNTLLTSAIRLYEKFGFQTVHQGPHPEYRRADIYMVLHMAQRTGGV